MKDKAITQAYENLDLAMLELHEAMDDTQNMYYQLFVRMMQVKKLMQNSKRYIAITSHKLSQLAPEQSAE